MFRNGTPYTGSTTGPSGRRCATGRVLDPLGHHPPPRPVDQRRLGHLRVARDDAEHLARQHLDEDPVGLRLQLPLVVDAAPGEDCLLYTSDAADE